MRILSPEWKLSEFLTTKWLTTYALEFQTSRPSCTRSIEEILPLHTERAMEMEPGLLNWNHYRVSPLEGMVRLWTHEIFAASRDLVNYLHWRPVPFTQE
jgi:hypothetical protein